MPFGLNIGYGYGNNTEGTENAVFYGGKLHKLNHVHLCMKATKQGGGYSDTWVVTSSDGRCELTFTPLHDEFQELNYLVVQLRHHRIYGRFTGKVILDNGEAVVLESVLGVVEELFSRW